MTYTRRQFTRVEYVLPTTATNSEFMTADQAITAEAQGQPVTFEASSDRHVLYFDLPDGA